MSHFNVFRLFRHFPYYFGKSKRSNPTPKIKKIKSMSYYFPRFKIFGPFGDKWPKWIREQDGLVRVRPLWFFGLYLGNYLSYIPEIFTQYKKTLQKRSTTRV